MINKKPKLTLRTVDVKSRLRDMVLQAKDPSLYSGNKMLKQWTLAGLYYRDEKHCFSCGGQCDAMAILINVQGKLRFDCPACSLIDMPRFNPIPIEESHQLLKADSRGCMQAEALMFSVNLGIISIEDYVYYALIPFSGYYELNEYESAIVKKVNTAFTTHIDECYSKYELSYRR